MAMKQKRPSLSLWRLTDDAIPAAASTWCRPKTSGRFRLPPWKTPTLNASRSCSPEKLAVLPAQRCMTMKKKTLNSSQVSRRQLCQMTSSIVRLAQAGARKEACSLENTPVLPTSLAASPVTASRQEGRQKRTMTPRVTKASAFVVSVPEIRLTGLFRWEREREI